MTDDAADAELAAALGQWAAQRDPFQVEHTVQVTSFGGAGTTALCNHLLALGVDLQRGPAQWPFKHQRFPPPADEVPRGFRVVYLLGDPRDAIVSIFRRRYQIGHFRSLHGRDPDADVANALGSLGSYLDHGVDVFELEDHVDRWLGHPVGYPVLFVRYEHLAGAWADLRAFIGLEPDQPAFAARPRASDWRSLPPDQARRLDVLYGRLANRIAAFPPSWVT